MMSATRGAGAPRAVDDRIERTFTCRECGTPCTISEDEMGWFARRDLAVPKRCRACRHCRRQAALRRT